MHSNDELVDYKCLGKQLGKLLWSQSEDKVSFLTDFFTRNGVNTSHMKKKVITHALLVVHPDKHNSNRADKERAESISKILTGFDVGIDSANPSPNVACTLNPEMEAFRSSLFNSAFQDSSIESYLLSLGRNRPSVLTWLNPQGSSSPISAPVKFIDKCFNPHGHVGSRSLVYTGDIDMLLIRIAVLELVIQQLCPDQAASDVIFQYMSDQQIDYTQCLRDPLLCLMNEIIIQYASSTPRDLEPRTALSNVNYPAVQDILSFLLAHEHFPNKDVLINFIAKWTPGDYLPHIRELFIQLLANFDATNKSLRRDTNRGSFAAISSSDGDLILNIKNNPSEQLVQSLQFDHTRWKTPRLVGSPLAWINKLPDAQKLELYREHLLEQTRILPASVLVAKFKLFDDSQSGEVSNSSLGEVLAAKLKLINQLINIERQKAGLLIEEPHIQPVIVPPTVAFLAFYSSANAKVSYIESVQVLNPIMNDTQNARYQFASYDSPEAINPVVVDIVQKCLDSFSFQRKISLTTDVLNTTYDSIFNEMGSKLKGTLEEKLIMKQLYFAKLSMCFNDGRPSEYQEIFNEHVDRYVGLGALPVVLECPAEGFIEVPAFSSPGKAIINKRTEPLDPAETKDFANIVPTGPHQQSFFNPTLQTVDIKPEALMEKPSDACRALPAFKVCQLLDDVAEGKQNEANAILQASDDIQNLLRTPGEFSDYSGRKFNCTAYEYAWWTKDKHMRCMLESHMNDETKTQMLEKIDAIEHSGLAYKQHGVEYRNAHYDMSFILKNVTLDEFHHLKALLGQSSDKLNTATQDNYQTISFTATEYEQLKKELAQQKVRSLMRGSHLKCVNSAGENFYRSTN